MKRTARITRRLIADGKVFYVSGGLVYHSAELLVISPPFRGALAAEPDAYQAFMERIRKSPLLRVESLDGTQVVIVLDVRLDVASAHVVDDQVVFGVSGVRGS